MSIVTALSRRFIITYHARERFVERFSDDRQSYTHLKLCKMEGCRVCTDLTYRLAESAIKQRDAWDQAIVRKLENAEEIRVFHNNTAFMDVMYKRYGYDGRYHFFTDGLILWVVCEDDGKFVVKTCVNVRNPINGSTIIRDFVFRPKYRKKQKV